jgi:asparagine synthase (glutamine-hydrolysing)
VDSAAIVAAMARAGEGPPSTFTIGFPGHGSAVDEREDAAETARVLGAVQRADTLEEAGFPALVDRCVDRLEEPCGIPSAPALLQLSGFARRDVKVVLSGQGADEPLGGYTRHQAMAALWLVQRAPDALRRPVRGLAARVPRAERLQRAAGLVGAGDARAALLRVFDIAPVELRRELTGGPAAEAAAERRALADGVLADVGDRDLLEQGLYLDTHLFLPDGLLIYGDKMSMAHGLEQRVPFLDLELLRWVERVPASVRIRHGRRKWLYRRALGELLPGEIIDRPKRSFSTPYDDWLRTSLGAEVARRYAPDSPGAELVDGAVVARLVDEHRRGRADRKRLLYCLLELARWHQVFVTGDASAPAHA